MTITKVTYTGNGTTRLFTFPFPYIARAHVKVLVGGVLTTAFAWANDSTLNLDAAPATGVSLVIFRQTPYDSILADFSAGSAFREVDLEDNFTQFLYVLQELNNTISSIDYSTTDALSGLIFRRVANVAAIPVAPRTGDLIEVVDTTGLQAFSPLTGIPTIPGAFTGEPNLSVRLAFSGTTWTWVDFKANNPDARYLKADGGLINLELTYRMAAAPGNTTDDAVIVWLKVPATTPPVGFLYANGSAKSRNQYPTLFSKVGTQYGVGDGVTTFNIPLEANLVNPFNDPAFKPFVKFNLRNGDDGVIMVGAAIRDASFTFNVNGSTYTARNVPDVDSVLADQQSVAMTPDGQYVAIAGAGTDKLWTAIRNGNGWTKMTVTNPPTFNLNHVSIHPNGVYMIALPASPSDPVYSWLRSGLTWGSRATVGSNLAALGWRESHQLDWSQDGGWLVASGVNVSTRPVVHTFASNVLTPVGTLPAYSTNIGPAIWDKSGLYIVASAGTFSVGAAPAVWVRSGTSFALIASPTGFTSLINGKPTWNTDGTRLLMGNGYTGAGVKQWSFSNGVFTLLPTNITTGAGSRFTVYPQSNTEFFDWSTCRVVSIKTGTVEEVATSVVSAPFGALRDAAMATTA